MSRGAEPGAALARAAGALLRRLAARSLPQTEGTLSLPGLDADVEVVRDRFGIPHVYADGVDDLARAVGYVQAQDRLFQMELLRRFAFGRLAEIVGRSALPLDRFVRRLRLGWAARRDAAAAEPEATAWADAYAEGVNAFLAAGPLPLELRLLRVRPEPWTAADVHAPGKVLALGLSVNWESELARLRAARHVGVERVAALEPAWPHAAPVIVPAGVGLGGASNCWAIAGARSATGRPLLANDPHLLLDLPGIWYAQHLSFGGGWVAGFSVPGSGVVVLGRSEHVAWGFTAANVDTQDLYVERFDDDGRRYEVDGEWVDAEVVHEEIVVRWRRRPEVERVVVTRHGPVVVAAEPGSREALALRWSAHEPGQTLSSFLGLMRARSVDEADGALDRFAGPPQNAVLADVHGEIGYRLTGGPIPKREAGEGVLPVPGRDSAHEWRDWIPQDELPRLRNPPAGFVVNANNRIAGDDYPYFLGAEHLNGYRAQRIEQLLGELRSVTVEDCRRIQVDQLSLPGLELAAIARTFESDVPLEQRALELLGNWDGSYGPGSAAGAIYGVLMRHLQREGYSELRDDLAAFLGAGQSAATAGLALFERTRPVILRRLAARDDAFFTDGRTWDAVFRRALAATVEELRPGLDGIVWGDLHRVELRHPFHRAPLLGRLFARGPYPAGGDADTVWQMSWPVEEPYGPRCSGPSMRAVYDLSDPDGNHVVLPAGQSGHFASPHYDDFVPRWLAGELVPLVTTRERVEALAARRLTLRSGASSGG